MQVDEDHKHALVGDAFGDDKKNLEAGGFVTERTAPFS